MKVSQACGSVCVQSCPDGGPVPAYRRPVAAAPGTRNLAPFAQGEQLNGEGGDTVLPLDLFLADHHLDFRAAMVTGIKDCGRTITIDRGDITNGALLIATGGRFLRKLPGIEHVLTLCEGVAAAEIIGERLREMDGGHIAFGFGGKPIKATLTMLSVRNLKRGEEVFTAATTSSPKA